MEQTVKTGSGSDCKAQTKYNETPFDIATRKGHKDIVKFLEDLK